MVCPLGCIIYHTALALRVARSLFRAIRRFLAVGRVTDTDPALFFV